MMPEPAPRRDARATILVVAAAAAVGLGVGALIARGLVDWQAIALLCGGVALAALTFRRLEVGLIALLFTLPLDTFGRLVTSPVTITVYHVVLVLCLAAWLRLLLTRKATVHVSWLDVGAAAIVGAALWSLPFSLAPGTTAVSIVRLVFLWAFALLYANGIRDAAGLRRLLGWLVASGAILSVVGLAQYFLPGFDVGWIRELKRAFNVVTFSRVGAFFFDPNYFAGMLSAIVAVALAMLAHARTLRGALLWGGAASLTGLTLVLTYSRGGWVAAAVGLVVAALTAPRRRRAWLVGSLLGVVLLAAVLAPDVIVSRVASIANVDTDVSVATRYYMTAAMPDMIAARPVFGTGLGAFDRAYPAFRRPGTSFVIVKPHQVPLAFVVETGIAGIIAEIVLFGALVSLYWRRRPDGWDPLEAAVLAGTVALLVGTLFEYYLYFEYVWLFLGLSVVAARLVRSKKEEVACSPER
jgi:O-antigen ligase